MTISLVPVTVAGDATATPLVRAIVSSLPRSFSLAEPAAAAVHVVTGARGWPDRVHTLIDHDQTDIIVTDPAPSDPDAAARLAGRARITMSETFAGNAALAELAHAHSDTLNAVRTLTFWATANTPIADQLLAQLRILRTLQFHPNTIVDTQDTPSAALITLRASRDGQPVLVRLQASRTTVGPVEHVVRGYTVDRILTIRLPDSDTARAATVTLVTPEGGTTLPAIFESAHRTAWKAAHKAVTTRAPHTQGEIEDLASDIRLVATLTS